MGIHSQWEKGIYFVEGLYPKVFIRGKWYLEMCRTWYTIRKGFSYLRDIQNFNLLNRDLEISLQEKLWKLFLNNKNDAMRFPKALKKIKTQSYVAAWKFNGKIL